MERLQKIIAESGYCSRRKAEELILSGAVRVNGEIINVLGSKADKNDTITINGQSIHHDVEKVVYLLNKPKNVISSVKDPGGRTTVLDLVESEYRLYPVGRLDYDSSGLILLTNDGELANKLMHPKFEVPKTYEVKIQGILTPEEKAHLETEVDLGDFVTGPAQIVEISRNENKQTSILRITIHEGHNRQVRRMFEQVHHPVVRLVRIQEGFLTLGNLRYGEYRKLKPHEVQKLKAYLDGHDF